jgi:hypothetical protein
MGWKLILHDRSDCSHEGGILHLNLRLTFSKNLQGYSMLIYTVAVISHRNRGLDSSSVIVAL